MRGRAFRFPSPAMRLVPFGLALAFVMVSCGGRSGPAAYRATSAPSECREMLESRAEERDRCLRGDGDACDAAILTITNGIFSAGSSVRLVLPEVETERERCAIAFAHHGCTLGSGRSCLTLGGLLRVLGRYAEAAQASLKACDLGEPSGCWYAADIWRPSGPWSTPDARQRALAEKACDLQSATACKGLGDFMLFGGRPPMRAAAMVKEVFRNEGAIRDGLAYWERACLLQWHSQGRQCWDLREYLLEPEAPRAREAQWIIIGSSVAEGERRANAIPGGDAFLARRDQLLADLKDACSARGDAKACFELVELEALRYTHALNPSNGEDFADIVEGPFELCARGVAEACFASTSPGRRDLLRGTGSTRIGGVPELLRGCDLGSALACANAAYRLRGDPRAAALYGRACAGGIRWACSH